MTVVVALLLVQVALASPRSYSTNGLCRANFCINPIFPGLSSLGVNTLSRYSSQQWTCADTVEAKTPGVSIKNYTSFCARAIWNYDIALPADALENNVEQLVLQQESEAVSWFVNHLSGMGLDFWEYREPWLAGPCVQSIWRLSCYTAFPKCAVGDDTSKYLRPCVTSCQAYTESCGVSCCDESVECDFEHVEEDEHGKQIRTSGYVSHQAPSAMCTGEGWTAASMVQAQDSAAGLWAPGLIAAGTALFSLTGSPRGGAMMALLFATASLQGCSQLSQLVIKPQIPAIPQEGKTYGAPTENWYDLYYDGGKQIAGGGAEPYGDAMQAETGGIVGAAVKGGSDLQIGTPSHTVGYWRQKPDYTRAFEIMVNGQSALNSCDRKFASKYSFFEVCSANGVCEAFDSTKSAAKALSFCMCDRDWADPECRTKRKSHLVAWLLSVFFGVVGADQWYLGFPVQATLKMFTLGGFGMWWLYDIVAIGVDPPLSRNFRAAADFPHWMFVILAAFVGVMIGFIVSAVNIANQVRAKRLAEGGQKLHHEGSYWPATVEPSALKAALREHTSVSKSRDNPVLEGNDALPPPPMFRFVPEPRDKDGSMPLV
mmetsp:Transcript_18225/g.40262  ORF Transcript_18225/g.40262 Transcript_18225/m.40262 type:complete len:599 (+) Transcript_18225:127-1923(+)|eukprot:CAMPEP_0204252406 /NCGR_PEP_ID=MMETSP0468-20130131/1166_1 /ASSEMBLY_ACC=CAM_ASM_000383 /TAXON_ID=2969 /ORGANISM="Oxyrrhis marina" /LENGTH=598 /DNA_ID=CAMNT_0051225833 /DNA_START=119 /DNA_END=1915 /DNA_ORIENTATION=-